MDLPSKFQSWIQVETQIVSSYCDITRNYSCGNTTRMSVSGVALEKKVFSLF